jgi:hypothetical protein
LYPIPRPQPQRVERRDERDEEDGQHRSKAVVDGRRRHVERCPPANDEAVDDHRYLTAVRSDDVGEFLYGPFHPAFSVPIAIQRAVEPPGRSDDPVLGCRPNGWQPGRFGNRRRRPLVRRPGPAFVRSPDRSLSTTYIDRFLREPNYKLCYGSIYSDAARWLRGNCSVPVIDGIERTGRP